MSGVQQRHQAERCSTAAVANLAHQLSLRHVLRCCPERCSRSQTLNPEYAKQEQSPLQLELPSPHREARWLVAAEAHSVMTLLAFQNLDTVDIIEGIPVHAFSKLLHS